LARGGASWYRPAMRASLVGAFLSASLAGCINPFGNATDPTEPGDSLGSYSVSATQTETTCGAGALGAPADWTFTVRLSRDGATLYWDTGSAPVPGSIGADGMSFTFETSSVTDMRATSGETTSGGAPPPPCSIQRTDAASGALASATTDVPSFTGTLTYGFSPTTGSDCLDLVASATPTFATLPCSMSYAMNGTRSGE
jgi:hypothetical protein